MAVRLKSDVMLTIGSGAMPVDLFSKSTQIRLPLSADEAAVAMLLTGGSSGADELTALARQHQVIWDRATTEAFFARIADAGFFDIEEEAAPLVEAGGADLPWLEVDGADSDFDEAGGALSGSTLIEEEISEEAAQDDAPTVLRDFVTSIRPGGDEERSAVALESAFIPEARPPSVPAPSIGLQDQADRRPARPGPGRPPPAPSAGPPSVRQPSAGRAPAAGGLGLTSGNTAGSLASAAICVRDGRLVGADELLSGVLAAEPDNVQALAMLGLIEKVRASGDRRRRRRWPVAVAAGLLLAGATAALALISVPQQVELPCTASFLEGSVVKPAIAGVVKRPAKRGQILRRGDLLATVSDEERAGKLASLRASLASDQELLQIMRTGGTDAEERRLRAEIVELTKRRKALVPSCPDSGDCAHRAAALAIQLERASTKLKFCEWQALPADVRAVELRMAEDRQQVEALAAKPLVTEVRSPQAGLVLEIAAEGERADPGRMLARLVAPDRFVVEAAVPPDGVIPGGRVTVWLRGQNTAEIYHGPALPRANGTVLRVEVRADDVKKVNFEGACTMGLDLGRISLARAIFKRVRQ